MTNILKTGLLITNIEYVISIITNIEYIISYLLVYVGLPFIILILFSIGFLRFFIWYLKLLEINCSICVGCPFLHLCVKICIMFLPIAFFNVLIYFLN